MTSGHLEIYTTLTDVTSQSETSLMNSSQAASFAVN